MIRRLVWVALILGAAYFTVQAGEFSTRDIFRQRSRERQLQTSIDSLQRDVDSLEKIERLVRTDPVTQERIAREEFGMVRSSNEIIYKFVKPDSADSNNANQGTASARK